ncbi:hypothetical protein [Cryomorpha ignava]|nr:hypothetical protein [Cryomorpha ignava]
MMKTILLSIAILLGISFNAKAQEEGKFRGGLNLGVAIPSGGAGFLFDLELKYNLKDNMNVGFRYGSAVIAKAVKLDSGDEFESANISANASYMATYDYYFVLGGSFNPFVGAGVGAYTLASVSAKDGDEFNDSNLDANTKFGGFIRGGFEASKFRFTLEYDFIPKSTLQDVDGNEVGSITNNYLGVTVGFYVGGGKW